MSNELTMDDLTDNERAQFEKAIAEGDTDNAEWRTLMIMATVTAGSNGAGFKRRQAIRRLYAAERAGRA